MAQVKIAIQDNVKLTSPNVYRVSENKDYVAAFMWLLNLPRIFNNHIKTETMFILRNPENTLVKSISFDLPQGALKIWSNWTPSY